MSFDLDTFLFELANFVVLLVLMQRLVYKPLREGVARRRAELEEREARAAKGDEEIETLRKDVASRARAIDELREATLRDAAVAAAEERARILDQAREDAAADRARAQRVIEAERDAAEASIRELAVEHSTKLASKLLAQLAPSALDDALLDALVEEVRTRSESWRAEGLGSAAIEVRASWAKLPDERRAQALRAALEDALGHAPELAHREEPALVAGLVLRVGHRVLDASVAGELEAFRARARELLEDAT